MCGISGYVGTNKASDFVIDGLYSLEYRGYDSAGIAILKPTISVFKSAGKVSNLEAIMNENDTLGNIAIGHTRWATHGIASSTNSHPHLSNNGKIAVVHNGIIENYKEIKNMLIENGFSFKSETDTEVIPNLIEYYYNQSNDYLESVTKCIKDLKGSYALCIISNYYDGIIVTRKDSPLIIAKGIDGFYIASDTPALIKYTKNVYYLNEEEIAYITKDNVILKNINDTTKEINFEFTVINQDLETSRKDGFDHFMLKEINEQPKVVANTLRGRLKENSVYFEDLNLTKEDLARINKVYIVACGTAYYAGLYAKVLFENLLSVNVITEVASEFRYSNPLIDENTLVVFITQSGETADTLAALKYAKEKGSKVISIVNVVGSSIARLSDDVIYTVAGVEIAVASTKAYTAQVIALNLLTLYIAQALDKISIDEYKKYKEDLEKVPSVIENVIKNNDVEMVVKKYINSNNVFYIGRSLDYCICLEAALKLKEISYLPAFGYQAGELKHGPIALIDSDTLVVGLLTQDHLFDKTISNIIETKSRGAKIVCITNDKDLDLEFSDDVIYIDRISNFLDPLVANVVNQLVAYYFSKNLGLDVDKPRNLAKSVTVE